MELMANERWDADFPLPEPRSNMPLTLGRRIEAAFFFGGLRIFRMMSIERGSALMGHTMRMLGPLIGAIHKRGTANLRLVYPEMTAAERSAIMRDVWENVGRTFAELAHGDAMPARVHVEDPGVLEALGKEGGQAIFISGHFANWEMLGATLTRMNQQVAMVYRAPNNVLVDKFLIDLRSRIVSRRQIPKGKRGGRDLITALNNGQSLAMLVDQKLNDGIESPFLGFPAMTAPAAARLAIKRDLPIIPVQLIRRPGARFVCTFHPPIRHEGRTTEELTGAINDVLSAFVLARPEQWMWLHRRWPKHVMPD